MRFTLRVPRLDIGAGARMAFVGHSGCGKSTLLEMLALLLAPTHCGTLAFSPAAEAAHDVAELWAAAGGADRLSALRGRYIGFVLQTGGLLPFLTVRENIELPRRLLRLPAGGTAAELAERLGIGEQLHKRPATLSVGQRQRAGIARALAHAPPVVIADEPTAALDPVNAEAVMRLLVELAGEQGVTLVVATHEQRLAARLGLDCIEHRLTDARPAATTFTVAPGG